MRFYGKIKNRVKAFRLEGHFGMGGKVQSRGKRGKAGRAARIVRLLDKHYPAAACSLVFEDPLQLMVATVLSAQCTDARVNQVTPALFRRYRSAADYAAADPESLMEDIRSTGFFRNKAKNIIAANREISRRFAGNVPATLEELVSLPGVGRKTANVILGNAFGIPGLVVDTHVGRVTGRLGLTEETDPVKAEFDLMKIFPRERWTLLSHQFIAHGRKLCRAPKPFCAECFFDATLCPSRSA
jgi:endonuclease-3